MPGDRGGPAPLLAGVLLSLAVVVVWHAGDGWIAGSVPLPWSPTSRGGGGVGVTSGAAGGVSSSGGSAPSAAVVSTHLRRPSTPVPSPAEARGGTTPAEPPPPATATATRTPAARTTRAATLAALGWEEDGMDGGAVYMCRLLPPPAAPGGRTRRRRAAAAGAPPVSDAQAPYLPQPPPAWDVPPGGHPLAQAQTPLVRRQLARQRAAAEAVATAGLSGARAVVASGAAAAAAVAGDDDGIRLFHPLPLGPYTLADDEPAGGGAGTAYRWPLPALLPLPALVLAGEGACAGGGKNASLPAPPGRPPPHAGVRRAMRRLLGKLGPLPHARGKSGAASALRRRVLTSLPLAEALRVADASAELPDASVAVGGDGGDSGGWYQPWVAPVLRMRVTPRTLDVLTPPELRLLARALVRTCGDIAAGAAADVWLGAVMAAGALDDAGCGVGADAEGVMQGGGAAGGGARTNRAARRAAGAAGTGDAEGGGRGSADAAEHSDLAFDSLRLWHGGTGDAAPLRVAVLRVVEVDVRASDPVAIAHIGRRAGSARGVDAATGALSADMIDALLAAVRATVPPLLLAAADALSVTNTSSPAPLASAGATSSSVHGQDDADPAASAAGVAATLEGAAARLRGLPALPRGGGAWPGDASAGYADQPLPWEGQEEAFMLAIGGGGKDGAGGGAVGRRISAAASADTEAGLLARLNLAAGVTPPPPPAVAGEEVLGELTAATMWGAVRALQTLTQVVQGWGVAAPLTGAGAPALLRALLPGDDDDAPSLGIAGLATSLSPVCAAAALRGAAAARAAVGASSLLPPDPSAPLPVSLPLTLADRPWKAWRGLSFDTARHYMPVPTVRRTVDALAASRASVLHWHWVDAQSWPLQLASLGPNATAAAAWGGGAFVYTRADAVGVVRYAADRGIRVVPEVDVPAHTRALGLAASASGLGSVVMPCHAVAGGALHDFDKYALDPRRPATYAAMAVVLGEVTALFPDAALHVGADEVVAECWEAGGEDMHAWVRDHLPALHAALADVGDWRHSTTYLALLAHFLHAAGGIVRALGRAQVAWGDSHQLLSSAQARLKWPGDTPAAGRRTLSGAPPPPFPRPSLLAAEAVAAAAGAGAGPRQLRARDSAVADALRGLRRALRERRPPPPQSAARRAADAPATPDPVDAAFAALLGNGSAGGGAPRNPPQPLLAYTYPSGVALEAWKCWERHGDDMLLSSAEDDESQRAGEGGAGREGREGLVSQADDALPGPPSRPLINAACTYLDYSPTWVEFARKWPLPESPATMARLAAVLRGRWERWAAPSAATAGAAGDAASPTAPPPNLTLRAATLLSSPWPYSGGEAGVWTERMDGASVMPRAWPRAAAVMEVLGSQSLAFDRVARAWAATPSGAGDDDRAGPASPSLDSLDSLQWARHLDDLGALAPQLRLTAVRLLQFTVRQMWARGLAGAALAVYDLPGRPPPPRGWDALAPAAAAAAGPAADPAWPPRFKPFSTNEHADTPGNNGQAPGIEQSVQRHPAHIPQPPPPHPQAAGGGGGGGGGIDGVEGQGGCATPACELRFLVWNVDNGGAERRQRQLRHRGRANASNASGGGADATADAAATHARRLHQGERWKALTAALAASAGAFDVVAVVEAVAWDAGRADRVLGDAHQTLALQQRAGKLGFPYIHLLAVASGYHLALLSTAPITVVAEEAGAVMQRGLLVADTHGVRWILAHLHAHDPRPRAREAAWVAELARRFDGAGVPVVFAGDTNSLSPLDAGCHAAAGVAAWLAAPLSPAYLRSKFTVRQPLNGGGGGGGGGAGGAVAPLDYRPMALLLAPVEEAGVEGAPSSSGAEGAVPLVGPLRDAVHPTGLVPGGAPPPPLGGLLGPTAGCPGSIPTGFATDPTGPAPMPPLRIDNVLMGHAMHAAWAPAARVGWRGTEAEAAAAAAAGMVRGVGDRVEPPPPPPLGWGGGDGDPAAACAVLRNHALALLSDHFPVACAWARRRGG